MTRLSETQFGGEWLSNFADEADRVTATALIDGILLVDRNTFVRELRSLIATVLQNRADQDRPIALFAERAVPKKDDKVLPFFRMPGPGGPPGRVLPL